VKPPLFEYDAPSSVDEALALLAEHGGDAKVLAGGQSLVPLLNFRLARPARLIDINNLGALAQLRRSGTELHIGAMTRQSMLERSETVEAHWPLLHEAMSFVAHAQIRNRGTVGGSIAHADPAAELPVALAALDGSVVARSQRGERTIRWDELFVTHLTTSLEPDELLVEVRVPELPERTGSSFTEYARRHGDFALGGAAVTVTTGDDGTCERATIALLAAAATPLRATEAEQLLAGRRIDAEAIREAAAAAVEHVQPTGDIHGSSGYRQRLIEAMVRRAITAASGRVPADQDVDLRAKGNA
jgi:carbon-monoxide dehydrogenase medium subunit/6-hydroxypseudooxynicotine dehydrogenase subunit alpha